MKLALIFAAVSFAVLICLGTLYSNARFPHFDGSPDFDGNGTVGFSDFILFADVYGLRKGAAGYDVRFDLDGDGAIGLGDFLIFSSRYGEKVPVSGGDREALVALYNATDGPNWENNTNWLTEKDISTWYGVGVQNGRVTSLYLARNKLSGSIPTELGRLNKLIYLVLSRNGLSGGIPPELGQLTNLENLDLSVSSLNGPIPAELGQLKRLKSLRLWISGLTGEIPRELGQLTDLEILDLSWNNDLTGPIPAELGQLTKLKVLELDLNDLTGAIPPELGQLANLETLDLAWNDLTGAIPPELARIRSLKELRLGTNDLTGTIPPELGQLANLEWLSLCGNELSGRIPSILGKLTNLEWLSLCSNELTGRIPPELGKLSELTRLRFDYNEDLTGPLPQSFTGLTLEELQLKETQVCVPLTNEFHEWLEGIRVKEIGDRCVYPERDALVALYKATDGSNWKNRKNWLSPEDLGEWYGVTTDADGGVTKLDLQGNNMRGTIPHPMGQLTKLKTLNLSSNAALSGPLPLDLTRLTLDSLALDGTQLCAPPQAEFHTWLNGIPERTEVARCTDARADYYALVELYNGTDGSNWKNATNWASTAPLGEWYGVTTDADGRVTRLGLFQNNLRGAIPRQLSQLTHLEWLKLGSNELTGTIPPELGKLTNLEKLDLGVNQLRGEIPSEIGQLTSLRNLLLFRNQLRGEIPSELGHLTNLRDLLLQTNRLTGGIPSELGQLTNLGSLGLTANWLTGEIPAELGQLTDLYYLSLSQNELTGEIPPELGQLINLNQLNIQGNELTGAIPAELGGLAKLGDLDLRTNELTGPIPAELGRLTNLRGLYLGKNQLTGEIPSAFGRLVNLRTLSLPQNALTDRLPPDLGRLTNLERLDLSSNRMTGEIPHELGQLTNLKRLDLSLNQLSGAIPSELGNLDRLQSLNLASNGGLSGSLPHTFTRLNLESLLLKETLLCVPQDAEFQAWLREIPDSRVPNCIFTDVSTAYLTQATQSLEYPVPLLAGEAALLRVFVTAAPEVDAAMPPVRASFYLNGAEVHTTEIDGQTTSIPWQISEGSLLNSANAVVPGSLVMPGLEMVVEIDPNRTLDPGLGVGVRLPVTGRTAVDVRSLPPFELTLVPFLWIEDPDRSVLTEMEDLSIESDQFRLTRDILPVSDFQLTIHEPVSTSVDPTGDSYETLMRETELIYAMEGAQGHYMGIFREKGEGGLLGIAKLPGYVSLSIIDEDVIAHELGHNLNLFHAPGCGALGTDPDYPTGDGSIGAWGYDFLNETLVSPETSDLMTYCRPKWISEFSYSRALRHRYHATGWREAAAYRTSTKGLLLWGGVNDNKQPFLEPAFVVNAQPSPPQTDGPYRLRGEAEDGSTVFDVTFGIAEIACGGEGRAFALILPVQPDWADRLSRIAFSGPEGVSVLDGEEDPSATLLLDRATGSVRGILRDWSEPAAKRAAASLGLPEPDLEVLVSRGIPDAASWTR